MSYRKLVFSSQCTSRKLIIHNSHFPLSVQFTCTMYVLHYFFTPLTCTILLYPVFDEWCEHIITHSHVPPTDSIFRTVENSISYQTHSSTTPSPTLAGTLSSTLSPHSPYCVCIINLAFN